MAEESGGVANLVLEAVILGVAGGGVGAAITGSAAILTAVGIGVGDETLFLLKQDDEDLGVDLVILGGLINNLGGGLARANGGAVTEAFFRKADKVTVGAAFPMPGDARVKRRLFLVESVVAVVAGVFLGEEGLDFVYGHRVVVAHHRVTHNVARIEAGGGGGTKATHHEESQGSDHTKEEDGAEKGVGGTKNMHYLTSNSSEIKPVLSSPDSSIWIW